MRGFFQYIIESHDDDGNLLLIGLGGQLSGVLQVGRGDRSAVNDQHIAFLQCRGSCVKLLLGEVLFQQIQRRLAFLVETAIDQATKCCVGRDGAFIDGDGRQVRRIVRGIAAATARHQRKY